jgi:hypothetical protein
VYLCVPHDHSESCYVLPADREVPALGRVLLVEKHWSVKSAVFFNVALCSLVEVYQRSFETFVNFYQTMQQTALLAVTALTISDLVFL